MPNKIPDPQSIVGYILLFLLIMILWNWLVPSIFGLRSINYWESIGLYVLINFLRYIPE